ncbi:hypothetical protein D3C87_1649710 [compost metagenome]
MYRPITKPSVSGSTSSARYAMATAGTPPIATPCSARKASRLCQSGATAAMVPSTADASKDQVMMRLRGSACENRPTKKIAMASRPVHSDSTRLLCAGDTPNAPVNKGISGCTQYKSENVEKPAANKAHWARRSSGVPRARYSVGVGVEELAEGVDIWNLEGQTGS